MSELTIRRVTEADRAAIEELTRHTWDSGDYIMDVFDEWRQGADGPFLVAEWGGQLAAITKSSQLSPAEEWIEGVRVATAFRGKGIARRLVAHQVRLAIERGAEVVRYVTASDNSAMHRIAGALGMRRVCGYVNFTAPALVDDEPQAHPLSPDEAARVWAWVQQSEAYRHTGGLYDIGWKWQQVTEVLFREQAACGNILRWGTNVAPDVVSIVRAEDDDGNLRVGLVGGTGQALVAAAGDLRRVAHRRGQPTVSAMLPDLPTQRAAFRQAGYAPWAMPLELWLFELPLDAGRSLLLRQGDGVP